MTNSTRSLVRNERGGVIVLVAVSMVALLAMMALVIDLAMAFTARGEAQRAADSAALAGASAWLDGVQIHARDSAESRAYDFAMQNAVRNVGVDSAEVVVQVIEAERKVRVFITRQALPTWFSRFFGVTNVDIGANAAAVAASVGAAKCLKPFAVPDAWSDVDDDSNGNRVQDPDEDWEYGSDPYDRYEMFTGGYPPSQSETGYGSQWRNSTTPQTGDYGRQLNLKTSNPNDNYNWGPSWFFPWALPPDPNMEECDTGGGGQQETGGATYRKNICNCNTNKIELGKTYQNEPGDMIGPTFQGLRELMREDSEAYWDPSAGADGQGAVVNSIKGANWIDSPRVIKIAIFDPGVISDPGRQSIVFNNFALFFIEGQANPKSPVVGRFLGYVSGDDSPGPDTGGLLRVLKLVE